MVLNKPTKVWNKRSVLEPLHLNEILARMLLQGIPPFTKVCAALLAQFNPKIDNRKVSCSWDMLQLIASLIPFMCIKPVFFFNHLTLHGSYEHQTSKLFMSSMENDQERIWRKPELPMKHWLCSWGIPETGKTHTVLLTAKDNLGTLCLIKIISFE